MYATYTANARHVTPQTTCSFFGLLLFNVFTSVLRKGTLPVLVTQIPVLPRVLPRVVV